MLNEWGGYLLFDGIVDVYFLYGYVIFVLNYLGLNIMVFYEYLWEFIDFFLDKRYFSYEEYDIFLGYEEIIIEIFFYYLIFIFNFLIFIISFMLIDFFEFVCLVVFSKLMENFVVFFIVILIGGRFIFVYIYWILVVLYIL